MSTVNTICRLCLRKDENINKFNIFDLTLSDTLYWIFGIEIDVGDSYSKLICCKCLYCVKYVLRMKKHFQTNQYILKERICPRDYDVEAITGTRDASTSTENQSTNDRVIVSMSAISMINRPFVDVEKLEDSNICNNYEKIGESYRKKQNIEMEKKCNEEERISVPVNIFSSSPFLHLPKLENTDEFKRYEKLDNFLYKEIPLISETSQIIAGDKEQTAEKTNISSENVQTAIEGTCQDDAKRDMVFVSTNIFDQFNSPYVHIPKLNRTLREEGYKQIGEFQYQKIGRAKRNVTKKKNHYKDFYYELPTLALKELIMERHQEINGEKNTRPKSKCGSKDPSLFDVNEVFSVEVCKYCSQNFETKELLKIHCNVRHNGVDVVSKIRRKKKAIKKFVTYNAGKANCIQKTKFKKLPSLFEKLNLGKMLSNENEQMHYKKKWMSSNHGSSETSVPESRETSVNQSPETTVREYRHTDSGNIIPTETYVYQQQDVVWFPEVVGSETTCDNDYADCSDSDDRQDDKEVPDDGYVSSLRNKLTSCLKANSRQRTVSPVKEKVDKETADFIKQRLSEVKRTRTQLEGLKKLQTQLLKTINQDGPADERYEFVQNLLTGNKTVELSGKIF